MENALFLLIGVAVGWLYRYVKNKASEAGHQNWLDQKYESQKVLIDRQNENQQQQLALNANLLEQIEVLTKLNDEQQQTIDKLILELTRLQSQHERTLAQFN